MMPPSQRKALYSAETQVLRHGKTVTELIKLLKYVREDGGMNEAQCQHMDNLVARNEAIMAGLFSQGEDPVDLLREIAVEIGGISDLDRKTFSPDERISIEPKFELLCRIAAYFGEEGRCACCGPMEPCSRTLGVDVDQPKTADTGRPIAPRWNGVFGVDLASEKDFAGKALVIPENRLREVTAELVEGLTTDGGLHKQYHLEEALHLLVPNEFEECKKSWGWVDGIPE